MVRKTSRSVTSLVSTAAVSAVLSFAASTANAALTTYTSQSAYLGAVGATAVDTFNDLDIEPYDTPFPRTAGDITYVATTGPGNPRAYGASDDDVDWYLSSSRRTDAITFDSFGTPVAGAGGFFWGSDIAGYTVFAPYITVTATDSTGATLTYTITDPVPSSFLGFVSDATIVSLSVATGDQLGADGYGIWPTVNDLHLSVAAVPEPGTYAMLLAGLGLLGWTARRRPGRATSRLA
ncbi:PEP-CTERM sorting domain-containing protein [Pseudoduganella umbonata]|uniref:PEP-CTERM sorting domain-containing protein n=1 Tax=Pseudoduganella umbonata TaxID=864828 RepID=A0ABX5UP65_9BURK|nr:PEP-CTERM sorting domain-containing protein [Pseudoduganella umbonata]